MLVSHGGNITLGAILRRAMDHSIPLDDIVHAGIVLRDPELLRARAADVHEERARAKDRVATLEAGRRA
eukprot:14669288-Alexandrium_andersonii.AAC.1